MSKLFHLEEQELKYLHDRDFLSAKLRIQKTLRQLLEETQRQLHHHKDVLPLPPEVWDVPPKISRGENYESLPYLVLDYPRIFQQESTFAYRCMLRWGHSFSCTLQLSGNYWQHYQPQIIGKLPALAAADWWICVHNTPWEYHYRSDNYLPLQILLREDRLQDLNQRPFFKISRQLALNKYQEFPRFSLETLQQLTALLG